MSSISVRFNKFLSNIELTSIQIEDARTKYNGVCKKLHDYYYSSTYTGKTKVLVGSYGKGTAVAPPTDIDVLFIMPYQEFERYDSYYGNGQSQLLQDIKNILKEKYPNTDIRGDGQVVVVPFYSYKVELIPAFLLKNDNFYIPDAHSGGRWKETSPKAEKRNLTESNGNSNGNTIRLIKMIKAWKYYCNVDIKSLVIELRCINFLKDYKYADKSPTYYDWIIRDFLKEFLNYVNGNCKIPGIGERISYGNSWKSKTETALLRAKKACEYESDKDDYNATQEWKKIFGDRYPI